MQPKLLLIAYYWPPSGGAGVQRWAKMAQYLKRNHAWDIEVLTVDTSYDIEDQSLLDEVADIPVTKYPFNDPAKWGGGAKSPTGKAGVNASKSFKSWAINFIRANLFVPDPKVYWAKKNKKKILNKIDQEHFTHLITTGPPHSINLLGSWIKKSRPQLFWLMDVRDPWTFIDFAHKLPYLSVVKKWNQKQERKAFERADQISIVSPSWINDYAKLYPQVQSKLNLVYNGFDEKDFKAAKSLGQETLTFGYAGSINEDRIPWSFLRAIADLSEVQRLRVKVNIAGWVDPLMIQEIERLRIQDQFHFLGQIPHNEVTDFLQAQKILLLLVNETPNANGIIPGKIFEYLRANRPVYLFSKFENDAFKVLNENGKVQIYDRKEDLNLAKDLEALIENKGPNWWQLDNNYKPFSREAQADRINKILRK